MRSCLYLVAGTAALVFLAVPFTVLGASVAAAPGATPPVHRLTSVVRADSRSGRLVRTIIVSPRVVSLEPRKGVRHVPGASVNASPSDYNDIVDAAAREHDVDPLLVHSVISVESAYNPYAVSHKGAQGLMQLIPATARRFGVTDSFDVRQNVDAGVRYLKHLTGLYADDLRLTLAAYNAGEGAVAKYRNNIPPYRETEAYVYKVGRRYGQARKAADLKRASRPQPVEQLAVAVETHPPIAQFVDGAGRLHLRTATARP